MRLRTVCVGVDVDVDAACVIDPCPLCFFLRSVDSLTVVARLAAAAVPVTVAVTVVAAVTSAATVVVPV